jgi:hypothetical protein
VSATRLHINTKLIGEVTGIPLTTGLSIPFLDHVAQPSKAELMECFHANGAYEWEVHKNKIPIGFQPT